MTTCNVKWMAHSVGLADNCHLLAQPPSARRRVSASISLLPGRSAVSSNVLFHLQPSDGSGTTGSFRKTAAPHNTGQYVVIMEDLSSGFSFNSAIGSEAYVD